MAGQWARKRETNFAIPPAPDDFYPVLEHSIKVDQGWMRPKGIRAGRRTRQPAQRGARKVTGHTKFEFLTTPSASILLDMFGAVTGSGPLTFTPGSANESFVSQGGMTDSTGTVRPVTGYGCKLDDFTLSAKVLDFVILDLNYTGADAALHRSVADGATTNGSPTVTSVTAAFTAGDLGRPISGTGIPANSFVGLVNSATSIALSSSPRLHTAVNATATATGLTLQIGIALAAASYGSGVPWTFLHSSLTAAGASIASATEFSLKGSKNLRNQRHTLGSPVILEQLEEERFDYVTNVNMDFDSNAFSILQMSAGQASLVTTLADAIEGGTNSLVITQNVQVPSDLPALTKPGLESQSLTFEAGHATADSSTITAVLTNGETSAA